MNVSWLGPRDVVEPQDVEAIVKHRDYPNEPLLMKVYTGTLLTKAIDSGGHLNQYSVQYLVTGKDGIVLALDDRKWFVGATAIVAPASFHLYGSPHTVAVDNAHAYLAPKVLDGVDHPNPAWVLMLGTDLAITNGQMHRLSYQVTALYRFSEAPDLFAFEAGGKWNGNYFNLNLEETRHNPVNE